jgi:hypothetical protein
MADQRHLALMEAAVGEDHLSFKRIFDELFLETLEEKLRTRAGALGVEINLDEEEETDDDLFEQLGFEEVYRQDNDE